MLAGKKIIVTGAASGIGRATAVLAAREGADVAIADIDRAQAEETAGLVRTEGREAIVIEMDTSKAVDAQRMADETVAKAGNVMLGNLFGVEWGGRGVRANTVLPGQVPTPMTQAMFDDPEIAAGRAAVVPMGRVGKPEEMAEA